MKKIRVGIICGGKSAEHEISLVSAKNVYDAIDKEKYEPVLIGITKDGQWVGTDTAAALLQNADSPKTIAIGSDVVSQQSISVESMTSTHDLALDVVFPVLHGPLGEDGAMQGLLKVLDVPFVGPSVLGSAVGMDKDIMKRLLRDANIKISRYRVVRAHEERPLFTDLSHDLGDTLFVKPANMGSSIGISKVTTAEECDAALTEAFRFDTKVIIEEQIVGRELECGLLGNELPVPSAVGEVVPHGAFYSYEAKYIEADGAGLVIPAKITAEEAERVQQIAVDVFAILECEGLARVDVFLTEAGEIYVNEINTIPGFTNSSMYPMLFAENGIAYAELIDQLLQLAIARHKRDTALETSI